MDEGRWSWFFIKTAIVATVLSVIAGLRWYHTADLHSPRSCFFHVGVFSLLLGLMVYLGNRNGERLQSLAYLREPSTKRVTQDRRQRRRALADLNALAAAGTLNILVSAFL